VSGACRQCRGSGAHLVIRVGIVAVALVFVWRVRRWLRLINGKGQAMTRTSVDPTMLEDLVTIDKAEVKVGVDNGMFVEATRVD
jgi:hypothetical protein